MVGIAIFFIMFPQFYDSQLGLITSQLAAQETQTALSPWMVVIIQVVQALLLSLHS